MKAKRLRLRLLVLKQSEIAASEIEQPMNPAQPETTTSIAVAPRDDVRLGSFGTTGI